MGGTGLPYLLQRTVFESINSQLQTTFIHKCSYALRLEVVLADDVVEEDDGDGGDATAVVTECTTTA